MVWLFDGFRTETRRISGIHLPNVRGVRSGAGFRSGTEARQELILQAIWRLLSQKHAQSRSVNQQSQSNCLDYDLERVATPI